MSCKTSGGLGNAIASRHNSPTTPVAGVEIVDCSLDSSIAPIPVLFRQRTTKASISPAVRGRPGVRCAVPMYFCAISFRCRASKVSGVTMVAIWARAFRPNTLALAATNSSSSIQRSAGTRDSQPLFAGQLRRPMGFPIGTISAIEVMDESQRICLQQGRRHADLAGRVRHSIRHSLQFLARRFLHKLE